MKGFRSISGKNVPIYAWQTAAAASILYTFGPERLGGLGDLVEKLEKIEAEDEEARDKEILRVSFFLKMILTLNPVSSLFFSFSVEIVVN